MIFVLLRIIAVASTLTQQAPIWQNVLVDKEDGDNTGRSGKEKPRICSGAGFNPVPPRTTK